MILLLLGFIILLPILGLLLYKHSKLTGAIFISFPLVLVVLLVGWWIVATNHYFVYSTNLENESIGEYRLHETLRKDDLNRFGSYQKRENDNGYSYDYKDLFLSTDSENQIVSLSAKSQPIETSSGLKIGDTIERAKLIYGDHYYSYREMGLGKGWVYVDRNNKYMLTLWTKDDQTVENIWLSVY
ncbi:hypothetical protein [Halalkalibacter krulwichiae]|uniref:Uncharacterized protein n=1 Tax=Halalkalibacter krulwichiae TaxID=199441 RepID=A0A1X9MGE8_9BACI|nr:hypothetical protein [Halalkalibacter krulwichiae]ARK32545.1 hypothetical protein BkAM31D_23225 [Halalkalibacter krulwichiae]